MPLGAEPLSPSPRLQIKAQGPVPRENHLGCGWKTRKTSLKEGSSAPQNKKVPLPGALASQAPAPHFFKYSTCLKAHVLSFTRVPDFLTFP